MARFSSKQEGIELKKELRPIDFGFFELPHVDSLDCWCDPIAQYSESGRVFVLIHQCPTTH